MKTATASACRCALALLLFALLTLSPASATEQIPDAILIDGEAHRLHVEPFARLLDQPEQWERFRERTKGHGTCTANWRGYRAWWSLREGRLHLERMVYAACNRTHPDEADLGDYFPGQQTPVPADWYSGTLVVPLGQSSGNSHIGYSSRHARYRIIDIKQGRVVADREADHEQLMQWRRSQREQTTREREARH